MALNKWMNAVRGTWISANPLGLNETLLAMKAYAPYHHLYAVAMCFAISSNQSDRVPNPARAWNAAEAVGMVDDIVRIAGTCLNIALETAANEPQPANRVFSPQNWIKTKGCLSGINGAIRSWMQMVGTMPGGADMKKKLNDAAVLPQEAFEYRWSAD